MGQNLGVFPLEQTRHVGVAKSEHPKLTNDEIFSKNSNLCDHNSPTLQTDRQTDRQTTCDRNTALCTKVHRAVKIQREITDMTGRHSDGSLAVRYSTSVDKQIYFYNTVFL